MKITWNIKIVLRTDKIKKDGNIPIYFSVRVGDLTTRIPTGKTVELSNWDIQKSCVKKNSKHNQLLSKYLGDRMSDWETYMMELQTMSKPITLTIASDFLRGNSKITLFSFWSEQVELWQNDKEENTLKSYRSVLNMLKSFNSKLNFGDLNLNTIEKFDLYMAKEKGNAIGGRFVKHKCLKSIINRAIMNGHMKENPYRFFKIKASASQRAFLSIDEVKVLMTLEIPEKDLMLQKTRDYFVFSCLTGLRYSDVINLKFCNIKTDPDAITIEMTKTKKQVMMPLVPPAKAIIEHYNKLIIKTPLTRVFPYVDNQVLNRNLKGLMKLSGITKNLTFHVARHSFASCHVQLDTNIIHLKDLMGHAKITETQIYTKSQTADLFGTMDKMSKIYGSSQVM
ncbi:site-specific integrase [Mucilaginibacter sp. CAU 1740]|uniref:site-specific integrase n=1 Tax=Mucilaginibacter sp. CAU 1740 TaxID=3140365 RepID=UPI00325B728A